MSLMPLGVVLLATAGLCAGQQSNAYDGTWVLRSNGQNVLKVVLKTEAGVVAGSVIRPKGMTIDQDGNVTGIGSGQNTLTVKEVKRNAGQMELMIDDDRFVMILRDRDHASLELAGMRPWQLERVPDGATVTLATRLIEPDYPKDIQALREQLHTMVKQEQDARMAFDDQRMESEDAKNRPEVMRIFHRYGWVTNSLAGKDASHDFWLLVQHQTPEIQRQLLPALEKAAKSGDASMTDYAYLYDRVQVGLGKPQRWGSQLKCENGKPVLSPVEDPAGLDARRRELFMMPIAAYLKNDYLIKSCAGAGK